MKKNQKSSLKGKFKISKKEAEQDILEVTVEIITKSEGMILKDNSGKRKGGVK